MECVREDLSFSRQALQTEWSQGRHRGWTMNPSQLLHSSRLGGGGALRGSAVSRWLCRVEKSVRDSWLYDPTRTYLSAFVCLFKKTYIWKLCARAAQARALEWQDFPMLQQHQPITITYGVRTCTISGKFARISAVAQLQQLARVSLRSRYTEMIGAGLENLGKTCFMNWVTGKSFQISYHCRNWYKSVIKWNFMT